MSVKGDEISLTWDTISHMRVSCPGVFLSEVNKSHFTEFSVT